MKILFAPMIGGRGVGPLTRCMAIADVARKRKHEVLFYATQTFTSILGKYDFPFVTSNVLPRREADVQTNPIVWTNVAASLGLLDQEYLHEATEREIELIRYYRPDVIMIESHPSMALSAIATNTRFISTYSTADSNFIESYKNQVDAPNVDALHSYNAFTRHLGLETVEDISRTVTDHADALVVPSTPSLEVSVGYPHAHFTGHLLFSKLEFQGLNAEQHWSDQQRTRVYCYCSTAPDRDTFWLPTLLYLAQQNMEVKAITGKDQRDGHLQTFASAPGGSLAATSNVVIHPGTANSLSLAGLLAKPQICIPGDDSERLYNSLRLEKYGAGVVIRSKTSMDREELRDTIESFRNSDIMMAAVSNLQNEIISLGGPEKAVDILEND